VDGGLPVLGTLPGGDQGDRAIHERYRKPAGGTVLTVRDHQPWSPQARVAIARCHRGAVSAAGDARIPLLPGIATAGAGDARAGLGWRSVLSANRRYRRAEVVHGPFAQAKFCPAGGIDAAKA
jgi:2-keto-3-deoxy-6-phosphogluconate aldolase